MISLAHELFMSEHYILTSKGVAPRDYCCFCRGTIKPYSAQLLVLRENIELSQNMDFTRECSK